MSVYEFIKTNETSYKSTPITLADGYEWSMYEHVRKSFLYKNSKFFKGADDKKRPFKNIILPILNVAYRSEGFDVKDIVPFVNDSENYYKSFFFKKFHPRWARENNIDTAIDESVESYVDYGLTLLKNVDETRPHTVPLESLAFCDQTDVLAGPLCIKHAYSPDELTEMGWNKEEVDRAILKAETTKTPAQTNTANRTPGKNIEVYELHGVLPKSWLMDDTDEKYEDAKDYIRQMHIITYFTDNDGKEQGITLFKSKQKDLFKAIKRDNIFGRACGRGGIEELFEPQTWINYNEIQMKRMLDAAALMLLKTTDKKFAQQNKVSDLDQNELMVLDEGKDISQVTIQPQNKQMFEQAVLNWQQEARVTGSASDPALGLNPVSGTPLGTTELVTQQGIGIHEYRQGKLATFWGNEVYPDWVLPRLVTEMNQGQKFLEELTLEELQEVAETVTTNTTNQRIKEIILDNGNISEEEVETFRTVTKENFMKGGNKRFIEILKGEIKDLPVDVEINIAGKQKDLAKAADALNNIFRFVFSNPQGFMQVMQIPGMSKSFNDILEFSGLSPVNFGGITKQMIESMQPEPQMALSAPVTQ